MSYTHAHSSIVDLPSATKRTEGSLKEIEPRFPTAGTVAFHAVCALIVCTIAIESTAYATIRRVDISSAGGDGSTWALAINDLQSALAASVSGDEIWVAQGIYKPTSGTDRTISYNMLPGRKIYGGFPTGGGSGLFSARNPQQFETILSGDIGTQGVITDNSYHVVAATDLGSDAVLDGFYVQLGNANAVAGAPHDQGGGILISASEGQGGGGAFGPAIVGCVIRNCRASLMGGGVAAFRANGQLRHCVVRDNVCTSGDGGGVGLDDGALKLVHTTFIGNSSASRGGGVFHSGSPFGGELQLINCTFLGNVASGDGGGVFSDGAGAFGIASATFTNCMFSGNTSSVHGGGLRVRASTLINCTFSRNTATTSGGGVEVVQGSSHTTTVQNCILYRNTAASQQTQAAQINVPFGTLDIDYSCVQNLTGSFGGAGNTDNDPNFINDVGGDTTPGTEDDNLRLTNCSPVRNRGLDSVVPPDTENVDDDTGSGSTTEPTPDLDLLNRIVGLHVDMGGYENLEICLADLNGDCHINTLDLGILLAAWSIQTGLEPGCQGAIPCCADLNGDGAVNTLDLGILLAAWTDLDPPLPLCETPCGGGSMMMGGGGSGSAMSIADSSIAGLVDPPTLDPELLTWLMSADIQQLWAWYEELFGAPSGSED